MLFLALFLWFSGYPYPYYLNNQHRNEFAKKMEALSLPSNTQRLGNPYKAYGNLIGQSNKGVYFTCILIQSSLSENTLQGYFKGKKLSPAEKTNKRINIRVQKIQGLGKKSVNAIEELTQGALVTLPPRWFGLSKAKKSHQKTRQTLYAVFAIDGPYESDDFRCY